MPNPITVKIDSKIELPDIPITLRETSEEETGEPEYNPTLISQTQVHGIQCPLIALNGIAVDYNELNYLVLDAYEENIYISFNFYDRNGYHTKMDNVGSVNELQLQILPKFDDAYKKINMLFYVTELEIRNGYIEGRARYKQHDFVKSRFKCMGKKSTYELFEQIATETGMGFASNVETTDDQRYIYCDHKPYYWLLMDEIKNSASGQEHVYEWWIDFWNNLILCDLYQRVTDEDDMQADENKIWIAKQNVTGTINDKPVPVQVESTFTNHPIQINQDTYVETYQALTNTYSNDIEGTTKVVSVYNAETKEYVDNIVGDGDMGKDEFTKFEYGGEVYGGYDYVFAKQCRDIYLKKVQSDLVEITLKQPLLSIMKGDQIRLVWFDSDTSQDYHQEQMEELGAITPADQLDVGWIKDYIEAIGVTDDTDPMKVNLQVSGQYTVIGIKLSWTSGSWEYKLKLTRPQDKKIQVLPENEDDQSKENEIV